MTVTFGYILKQAYENALLTQPDLGRKEAERLIESALKPLLRALAEEGEKSCSIDAQAFWFAGSVGVVAQDACLVHMAKWADSEGIKVTDLTESSEEGPKFLLTWGE